MPARRAALQTWVSRPDGTRLRCQVEGAYDAPVLLLLQGQANSHVWWRRLRGDFEAWLTVTFDYRGTGESSVGGDDAWSTAGFADDAAAVIASLGREEVEVYATSMGGRVAQELAINHPHLVRRLVLACTSPGGPHAVERDPGVRRALAQSDPARRRRTMVDLFYSPAFVEQAGGYDGVPGDLLGDPAITPEHARRHLQVSAGHDAHDRLALISAPTLVIHGTDDRMVPSVNAETLADAVPHAQLRLFDGGRHGFFDERRDVVAPAVASFLRG